MEIIAHCPHRLRDPRAWLRATLGGPADRLELDVVCTDGRAMVGHHTGSRWPLMPLDEALALVALSDRGLLLDVKDALAPVAAALSATGLGERTIVSGERVDLAGTGARAALTLPAPGDAGPLGLATARARERVRDAALASADWAAAVCVDRRFLSEGLGGELSERGVELIAWTVDTRRHLERARGAGAAAIVTNRPDRLSG